VQRDELCGTSSLSFVDDRLPKQLKKKIFRLLSSTDCTSGWLRVNSRLELDALLLSLFPIVASAPAEELCGTSSLGG